MKNTAEKRPAGDRPPYRLLDSGNGRKLEQFGKYLLDRPCTPAPWQPSLPRAEWDKADGVFSREGGNHWNWRTPVPDSWVTTVQGLDFKVSPTDFGHMGIFPEHAGTWSWIKETVSSATRAGKEPALLNLFAYTGGTTLAAVRAGASVCHLDASPKSVAWAKENAALNKLDAAPVRWIVDDVTKFLNREIKRGRRYQGIILDPPSFGRGARQEVFKIETALPDLLKLCRDLLADDALLLLLTCHTPGFTPLVMHSLLTQVMEKRHGSVESGELLLPAAHGITVVPSGAFARWSGPPVCTHGRVP